jgi:FG-GAP-like repeat
MAKRNPNGREVGFQCVVHGSRFPWWMVILGLSSVHAQVPGLSGASFRKVTLNPQFYSEGIQYGDIDRDGKVDIVAGPYWYPGPNFTEKKTFRQPRATPFPITGDSDCYSVFLFDLNQDGWLDILSFRKDGGAEAVWYENPKGGSGNWTERLAHSAIENESAVLLDMDGDGKPEVITNSKGYGGFVQPEWSRPASPWTFRAVTSKQSWGVFTHGIGAGDVNGDGRMDLIFSNGWWAQPPKPTDTPWVHTSASFGGRANPSESEGGAQMFAYDVDGDGDQDIISSQQAHGWGLAWHENQDQGRAFTKHLIMNTPAEVGIYGLAFSQLHALALADLDGDGLKDIVTGKRKGAHGNGLGADLESPAVLYGFRLTRPSGKEPQFVPFPIDSMAGVGTQLAIGDVNGDGSPDILTTRRDGAFVFLNQIAFPSEVQTTRESKPGARSGNRHGTGAAGRVRIWDWTWNLLGRSRHTD